MKRKSQFKIQQKLNIYSEFYYLVDPVPTEIICSGKIVMFLREYMTKLMHGCRVKTGMIVFLKKFVYFLNYLKLLLIY